MKIIFKIISALIVVFLAIEAIAGAIVYDGLALKMISMYGRGMNEDEPEISREEFRRLGNRERLKIIDNWLDPIVKDAISGWKWFFNK